MKKWTVQKLIKNFFENETLSYLFFGVLTTILSLIIYEFCFCFVSSAVFANTVSTAIAMVFAFFTNKLWVFRAPFLTVKKTAAEFFKFATGRFFTYALETGFLAVTVDMLKYDKTLWKSITMIIMIVSNYIISKRLVFKK